MARAAGCPPSSSLASAAHRAGHRHVRGDRSRPFRSEPSGKRRRSQHTDASGCAVVDRQTIAGRDNGGSNNRSPRIDGSRRFGRARRSPACKTRRHPVPSGSHSIGRTPRRDIDAGAGCDDGFAAASYSTAELSPFATNGRAYPVRCSERCTADTQPHCDPNARIDANADAHADADADADADIDTSHASTITHTARTPMRTEIPQNFA